MGFGLSVEARGLAVATSDLGVAAQRILSGRDQVTCDNKAEARDYLTLARQGPSSLSRWSTAGWLALWNERAPVVPGIHLLLSAIVTAIVTISLQLPPSSVHSIHRHVTHSPLPLPVSAQHPSSPAHLSCGYNARRSTRGCLSPPPTHRALHAKHSLRYHSLTPDLLLTGTLLPARRLNRMLQLSLVGALQRGAGAPSTAEHPPPAAASGRPRRRDHVHATAA